MWLSKHKADPLMNSPGVFKHCKVYRPCLARVNGVNDRSTHNAIGVTWLYLFKVNFDSLNMNIDLNRELIRHVNRFVIDSWCIVTSLRKYINKSVRSGMGCLGDPGWDCFFPFILVLGGFFWWTWLWMSWDSLNHVDVGLGVLQISVHPVILKAKHQRVGL